MLIPNIKKQEMREGKIQLNTFVFSGNSQFALFAKNYISSYMQGEHSTGANGNVMLIQNKNLLDGGYLLDIDEDIRIEFCNRDGLRNALSTIILLVESKSPIFFLQKQSIQDEPDCAFRSVLIDLARGLPDYQRLKEDVKRLALAKCNYLHLHLMDSMGICYQSNVLKMENGIRGTKLYTKEQMKDLVCYCDGLGIEIIPEFEVPAHAHYMVTTYPEFACQTDLETQQSPAVLCAGNERMYEFYSKLIDEICDIFPSQYIHMGGDELSFGDFPEWNYNVNWLDCKVCKKKMQEEGLNGIQDLYYYLVNRIYAMVSKRAKTLVMYNDQIDVSKPVPIPKDIIIQFWRISHKSRGPRLDCSYRKFLEQGFKVIASPYEFAYIDLEEYATPEKCSWIDFKNYKNTQDLHENVLGGEVCAWEYGNPSYTHYTFSFTSAAILLLAKMWNGKSVVYDEGYRQGLTKLIFGGETPIEYDVFELFGSIMPPRVNNHALSYLTDADGFLSDQEFAYHKGVLDNLKDTYSPIYRANLLAYLQNILK